MWTGHLLRRLPARNTCGPVVLYLIRQLQQQEGAQASPGDARVLPQGVSAAVSFLTGNHTVKQAAELLPGAAAHCRPSQPGELGSGQGARCTGGVLCPDERDSSRSEAPHKYR